MESGRKFDRGCIAYVGYHVTPAMLLVRFGCKNPPPRNELMAVERLRVFVLALKACKIGNTVSISYTPDGLPLLKVEQEYTLTEPNKKLP